MAKQITIYSSTTQVVECLSQPRCIVELPQSTILESIIAYDINYRSIQYTITGVPSNNARCPGMGEFVTVVKDRKTYSGYVTRCESDFIQINTGISEITVDNPSVTKSSGSNLQVRSHIPISRVSYRLEGLSWTPIGNLFIDEGSLSLVGAVTNNTGEILHGNIVLAAGDINQQQPIAFARSAKLQEASNFSPVVGSTNVIFYNAGIQALPQRANLQIEKINLLSIERIYQATTQDTTPSYGLQIRAPERLPSLQINVYQRQQYLGTSSIPETQAREPVTLILGRGGQVTITTNVSNRQIDEYQQETTIQSTIKNFEPRQIRFELRHFIGDASIIDAQHKSCVWDRRENGFIVWTFLVGPQQEYNFQCSFVVSTQPDNVLF